jgi:hypothetical protein
LIDKYLKLYFKYQEVFHKPVEKPVENFPWNALKRDQEGAFTTSSAFSVKEELEQSRVKVLYYFVTVSHSCHKSTIRTVRL